MGGQLVFSTNIQQRKMNELIAIGKLSNGSYMLQAIQKDWKPETIKIQVIF